MTTLHNLSNEEITHMGAVDHAVAFRTDDRAAIEKQWNQGVEQSQVEDGHSYSGGMGMFGTGITWKDKGFDSQEKAEEFLIDEHEKWESAWGVSFLEDGKKFWVVGGWASS